MNSHSREAGFTPACDFINQGSSIARFRVGLTVDAAAQTSEPSPGSGRLERIVIDRGLANRPPAETPTQTPVEPDGI